MKDGEGGMTRFLTAATKMCSTTHQSPFAMNSPMDRQPIVGAGETCERWELTADFERSLQLQKDGLTEEDLPRLDAEAAHLRLRHLDDLPRSASSHWWKERRGGCEVKQPVTASVRISGPGRAASLLPCHGTSVWLKFSFLN